MLCPANSRCPAAGTVSHSATSGSLLSTESHEVFNFNHSLMDLANLLPRLVVASLHTCP
jgi:hypothetical protein